MASVAIPDPVDMSSASPPPAPPGEKKPWSELKQAVKKSHRAASSILSSTPHSFTFEHRDLPNGKQSRLYFLGVPNGQRENTLLYVDLPKNPGSFPAELNLLEWHPLLDSFGSSHALNQQLSKEEQLMRERKRLRSIGITAYDYCAPASKFAFAACSNLFVCEDKTTEGGFTAESVFPVEAKSCQSSGSRLDPKLCPTNSDLLAFVCGSDVWVCNMSSGHEQRLTHAHKGSASIKDDPLSAGAPSFVVQEEFDRYTGYWWQTDTKTDQDGIYRILYEEVDESEVQILNIVSSSGDGNSVDEYRYPKAGTPNAKSTLKIVEFQVDNNGAMCNVIERHIPEGLNGACSDAEYLIRAGWTPDGTSVYAQVLDRRQQKLQLLLIPLHSFVPVSPHEILGEGDVWMEEEPHTDMSTYGPRVIFQDTSDIWIHVHDILHFLPQDNASELSFLWASQNTGFLHLYLVTVSLDPMKPADTSLSNSIDDVPVIKQVAVTSGDWQIEGKQIWLDEARKLVYFVGFKDTPLETHLYVTSYEQPNSPVHRLTEPGYSHSVEMDKGCQHFVSVYSCVSQVPCSKLYQIQHSEHGILSPCIGTLLKGPQISAEYIPPELFSFQSESGVTMHGMLLRPHSDGLPLSTAQGQKYPTVLFVYAGPQVQLISNAFKGIRFLRLHTLAAQGYAVVVIDSRGSSHRGLKFESHIRHRLGKVEVDDQVEGLQWLAANRGYIDLDRVAIHGWSYGGYISLMGLVQRPEVFKLAVAGAPVTDWGLYDTGYTERYMDLPKDNPVGYEQGSVLHCADLFPNEEHRLLIVHGLIDENVHFYHTSALINALVKGGKPYQLQVYPNERHGIRNPHANEHYETMLLSFLQQHL